MYAGKKLRALRLQLDKNQDDMAETLGLSRSYYAAVEIGKRPITQKMIEKIEKSLNVSEGYFKDKKDENEGKKVRGLSEGVSEGVHENINLLEVTENERQTRRFSPYFFYNHLTVKDLDFELSLEIENYKDAFNDHKLLTETLHALNPPAFLIEKFPLVPKEFSIWKQEAEEEFDTEHSHISDERQRKVLKLVDLYQSSTEHWHRMTSILIFYMHRYSDMIAENIKRTVDLKD